MEQQHYVEWKPFYSVGDGKIDDEHKQLLGIIDDLYVAVQMGHEQTRVNEALKRLAEYTTSHFEHEERVMREYNYPNYEAHKSLHDEMRRHVLDFQTKLDAVAERDLLQFLKTWWVGHIQNRDKAYSPYLKTGGSPSSVKD